MLLTIKQKKVVYNYNWKQIWFDLKTMQHIKQPEICHLLLTLKKLNIMSLREVMNFTFTFTQGAILSSPAPGFQLHSWRDTVLHVLRQVNRSHQTHFYSFSVQRLGILRRQGIWVVHQKRKWGCYPVKVDICSPLCNTPWNVFSSCLLN